MAVAGAGVQELKVAYWQSSWHKPLPMAHSRAAAGEIETLTNGILLCMIFNETTLEFIARQPLRLPRRAERDHISHIDNCIQYWTRCEVRIPPAATGGRSEQSYTRKQEFRGRYLARTIVDDDVCSSFLGFLVPSEELDLHEWIDDI
jgi:hypothetical protein